MLDAAWTRRQAGHIMGTIDITNATRPRRTRVGGVDKTRMAHFRKRFPPTAKRQIGRAHV